MSQVIVRMSITRTIRPQIKTGIYINPDWLKNGKITIPKSGKYNHAEIQQAKKAKTELDALLARYSIISDILSDDTDKLNRDYLEKAEKLTRDISIDKLTKDIIDNVVKKNEQNAEGIKTFADYFEMFINRESATRSNMRKERCLLRTLKRYEHFVRLSDRKRKNFLLDIDKIDKDTVEDFFDYFRDEAELSKEYPEIFKSITCKKIEKRGKNSVIGREKTLKSFFIWLNKNGYSNNQPFLNIEIGTERYGTPYFLTLEERNKIATFDIKSRWLQMTKAERKPIKSAVSTMLIQRDIFIFQCLCGCRVSDLIRLTNSNIDTDNILNYIPFKTKSIRQTVTTVPLNLQAQKLVEKYKNADKKGRLFPFISPQKYNDAIKDICYVCGINRLIDKLNPVSQIEEKIPLWKIASSHMARRTFSGNAYNKVHDPNIICSMTGHVEGSKAFNRYRTIDNDLKKKVIDLIS
jgi:integrase